MDEAPKARPPVPPEVRRCAGRPPAALVPEREQTLLDEAEKLFIQYGYHQVSIATIASTVHVAAKTIYVKFGDKRGLLKSIIERDMNAAQRQLAEIKQSGTSVRDRLEALACLMLQRTLATNRACLHADAIAARDQELLALVESARLPFRRLLEVLLREMPARRGRVKPDPPLLADAFFGFVLGPHFGSAASGVLPEADREALQEIAAERVSAFLNWFAP